MSLTLKWPWPLILSLVVTPITLTFNPLCELWSWSTHMQKMKVKDQSVQTTEWKQKDRQTDDPRTDGVDCITFLANAVREDNMAILFECRQYISLFQHVDYCSPWYNAGVYFLSKWRPSTILDVYATLDHTQRAFGAFYRDANFCEIDLVVFFIIRQFWYLPV